MDIDWKAKLQQIQDSGSLPEGDITPTASEEVAKPTSQHKGKLHISVEKKGRGGKTATIIYDFNGSDDELRKLGKELRHRLGTGGAARGGEILLQGDCRQKAIDVLRSLGYKV